MFDLQGCGTSLILRAWSEKGLKMAADTYNLIIFPKVREGKDEAEVKKKLAQTLNVEESKVAAWFASDKPTVILKEVADETADRYLRAILSCGASCNVQPAGVDDDGLSLVPKTFKTHDLFICPSCEHEEEVILGEVIEQCSKCGLVLAKWEEKMRQEKEKEAIRRRLLREQRLKGDENDEVRRKKEELERLRALEREIMKELGIKPPSKLWVYFEQYTVSMTAAAVVVVIGLTVVGFKFVSDRMAAEAHAQLVAAAPSEEMQQVSPTLATAIRMKQSGNEPMMTDMASTIEMLKGQKEDQKAIINAANQMLKGADSSQFMSMAGKTPGMPGQTLAGPDGEDPVPVNNGNIGGVSGIPGSSEFSRTELDSMSPPLLADGRDEILDVLSIKRIVDDPNDPDAPPTVVDEIEKMDGSKIVNLMAQMEKDQEWDLFLKNKVEGYLMLGDIDAASDLVGQIRNAVVRIRALGSILVYLYESGQESDAKVYMARVRLELDKIEDPDAKAGSLVLLGTRLSAAGDELEPGNSISRIQEMVSDTGEPLAKAFLHGHLAVAHLVNRNQASSANSFRAAMNSASQLPTATRISAFVRIAQRYYDARNLTLANEILAEAEVLAATKLSSLERSTAFGQIAVARAYMGDVQGAMMAVNNAGVSQGKQQVLAKVAESLIGLERTYQAQQIIDQITDALQNSRLELRLISFMAHNNMRPDASYRLSRATEKSRYIMDLGQRATVLSQYARLHARLGEMNEAETVFNEANDLIEGITGRVRDVNLGVLSLDLARSGYRERARETMYTISIQVVQDPIDSELNVTNRVLTRLAKDGLISDLPG